MSPQGSISFPFLHEFHCPNCSALTAYRSRYRSIGEQILLSVLMLKPVRCERCYQRSYTFRTVPVLERVTLEGKLDNQSSGDSGAGTRVA